MVLRQGPVVSSNGMQAHVPADLEAELSSKSTQLGAELWTCHQARHLASSPNPSPPAKGYRGLV